MDLLQSMTSPIDGALPPSLAAAVDMIGGVDISDGSPVVVTILETPSGARFTFAGKLPPAFVSLLSSLYDVVISSQVLS